MRRHFKNSIENIWKTKPYSFGVLCAFIISLLYTISFLIKTWFMINNPLILPEKYVFYIMFKAYNYKFFSMMLIYFMGIFLITIITSLVIAVITTFLFMFLKEKVVFRDVWFVSVLSFIFFPIIEIINIIFNFSANSFVYVAYLFAFIWVLLLTFCIFKVVGLPYRKKFVLLIFLIIFIIGGYTLANKVHEHNYLLKTNTTFHDFSIKLGNATILQKDDILSVCSNPNCIGVESFNCYEKPDAWECHFYFTVIINEFATDTMTWAIEEAFSLQNETDNYLEQNLDFYLDGEIVERLFIDKQILEVPINKMAIPVSGDGNNQKEAIYNTLYKMKALQELLLQNNTNVNTDADQSSE